MFVEWKPVTNFENLYSVSKCGKVKRIAYGYGTRRNKLLKPSITKDGYASVYLYIGNRKRKKKFIHSLVLEAFLGKRPKRFQVNHKDSNKLNNNITNLEYTSCRDNILHAIKSGHHFIPKGSQHGCAKLKEYQIKEIRSRYEVGDISLREIAAIYKIKSSGTISRIIRRKGWSHI